MSGLEILGALASSIAVAQMLLAGRSVASLVRGIPEIQNECDALRDEVSSYTAGLLVSETFGGRAQRLPD